MNQAQSVPKSVRFHVEDDALEGDDDTEEETFLSGSPPPPSTPSPTHSASTASSGGPHTPPSPGFTILMESKGSSPVYSPTGRPKIHPILSSGGIFSWDMAQDPATLPAVKDEGGDSAASLHSTRPLTRLILVSEAVEDWPLNLETEDRSGFLTVNHVLSKLHRHLRKPVAQEHFESQPPKQMQAITNAYLARQAQWPQSGEGLRRIDYLPGRLFQGLRVQSLQDGTGVWKFRLDCA